MTRHYPINLEPYALELAKARTLIRAGDYDGAGRSLGAKLESLLRWVVSYYVGLIPSPNRAKLSETEVRQVQPGKSYADLALGPLLGLINQCDLWVAIKKVEGRPIETVRSLNFPLFQDLRNRVMHDRRKPQGQQPVLTSDDAAFMANCLEILLLWLDPELAAMTSYSPHSTAKTFRRPLLECYILGQNSTPRPTDSTLTEEYTVPADRALEDWELWLRLFDHEYLATTFVSSYPGRWTAGDTQ